MSKRTIAFVAVLATVHASKAAAQTYSRQPATANETVLLRDYVARLTSDPALGAKRVQYQLPTNSTVQVVMQSKTCKDAAQAYHVAVRGASAPPISRQVVVIKVGSTRYVVLDPREQEGEYEITVIFNSSFQPLASFNS